MFQGLINLIFPPKCIFCGSILEMGNPLEICGLCFSKIPFIRGKLPNLYIGKGNIYYDDVVCVCQYSGVVKTALQRYKFSGKSSYYRAFAMMLSKKVSEMTSGKIFDIIISVPLHREREKERGYNQSYLIAKAVSKETGISLETGVLTKAVNTFNQSLLNGDQRYLNIKDVFIVKNADKIYNRSILLIDDIFTTGATANECCRVLKEAGARDVCVAVVASGRKY